METPDQKIHPQLNINFRLINEAGQDMKQKIELRRYILFLSLFISMLTSAVFLVFSIIMMKPLIATVIGCIISLVGLIVIMIKSREIGRLDAKIANAFSNVKELSVLMESPKAEYSNPEESEPQGHKSLGPLGPNLMSRGFLRRSRSR